MTNGSLARALFARWREETVAALGAAREELDAVNVYPVPDRDTGTNVYLTLEAAAASACAADAANSGLDEVARAFVDGALRGARGNSGVIMAQLLRVSVPQLVEAFGRADQVDPVVAGAALVRVLADAADGAYAAVERPVEGTILSVARAAANGATAEAARLGGSARLPEVLRAATAAAQVALAHTPAQLDELRRAGVVDAGGQALTVILDATERVLTGRVDGHRHGSRRPLPVPIAPAADVAAGGPAYEVMYLLDTEDAAVPDLRAALAPLGDSLVVVGGDGLWNVHVHVDDPGKAIEAGIVVGRPHRVVVTHLARDGDAHRPGSHGTRTVVATAAGHGLAELFAAAGAVVVNTADGHHPDTHELLDAVPHTGSDVVLLPNDRAVVPAAEVAAVRLRERGVRVAVIPTRAQVQGLAAIAVHDPGRGFDDDVVHMTAAAGHARHGAVTVATRVVLTSAGPCEPGDVLGVVDGDVAVVGTDLATVAEAVTEQLLGDSGELLTIVPGADVPDGLVAHLERVVVTSRPGVEVAVHMGGQAGYPLLLAVE